MKNSSKKHFSKIGIFLTIAFGLTIAQGLTEEPFAPKVDPPKNLENRSMWMNMIKAWKIPGKSEVIIPAYPGAAIVAFTPASWMESNDKKTTTLPVIVLATGDDPGKVTSFYKEKLKDWKYKNSFGMFDVFWTGREDFNNMDIEQTMTISNVIIMEAHSAHTDFLPTAKTAISIVYKPVK